MSFKYNKWRNTIITSALISLIIVVLNLVPNYSGLIFKAYRLLLQGKEISNGKDNQLQLKHVLRQNNELKQIANSYLTSYNQNKNISAIINILYDLAKKCKMTIKSIKPLKIIKTENLWLQPLEISFTADYERVFNFIRFIEKSDKVIVIRQLSITSQKGKKGLRAKTIIDVYLNL